MITRWLPSQDWARLNGTELGSVWPHLPADARVWVVERDGAILACGAFFPLRHHEGLWVSPSVRHSREVWRAVSEMLTAGLPFVTASVSPGVTRLIERLGGTPLPGQFYSCVSLASPFKESVCLPR